MLRPARASALPRRALAARPTAVRLASTAPSSSSSPPLEDDDPPRPSYFTAATIYPFILLSAITSLALNLSHQRTARENETSHLGAQIFVLEGILSRLREPSASRAGARLSADEQEDIERELEMVGLGRGKGKKVVNAEGGRREEAGTTWSEVFFGKKGKGFEEEDKTDWEKVFHEADEAERKRVAVSSIAPPPPASAATPLPPVSSPPSAPTPPLAPAPPSRPARPAVYL
ncbi:hypothetical protein JCM8547_006549 [Rhodosporidiobolus lusitaniae]